jgi:hypothetical protein
MPRTDVRSAFQYGLVIFTLTALLGLANATQLFGALDRNTLLTHLHSGTLGWITMGVIGITVWIFGGADRNMAVRLSALSTAAYVLAFWSGNLYARATFGVTELLVILYWWWFAVSSVRAEGFGRVDIPKLSLTLGLTTLVVGSSLGVVVQLLLASGSSTNPQDIVGGHASAQIGGYLVLVAAGIADWQLTGGGQRTRAGLAQAYSLFAGGIVLAIGVLLNVQPLLGVATLLQVIGIVIVIVRFGRIALGTSWMAKGGRRHIAIAVPFLVLGLGLEIALLQQIVAAQGDFTKVSVGLNHALDHSMFVGLMTNALFGAIFIATAGSREWSWADDLVFWGLNIGAASFIAVLLFVGSGEGAKPFASPVSYTAPIMGLAALLGIATLLMRLQSSAATEAMPARA